MFGLLRSEEIPILVLKNTAVFTFLAKSNCPCNWIVDSMSIRCLISRRVNTEHLLEYFVFALSDLFSLFLSKNIIFWIIACDLIIRSINFKGFVWKLGGTGREKEWNPSTFWGFFWRGGEVLWLVLSLFVKREKCFECVLKSFQSVFCEISTGEV